SGLLVTRIWGFGNTNDASKVEGNFFQELKGGKQRLNFDAATGIPKLDYVVSKAEELGIKLIVPLLNGHDDLGGINTYVTNYGGTKTSFFTDAKSQKAYLAYVEFIVNRYKTSPAIFSWELCNEPRCEGCDTSIITNWAMKVSNAIKKSTPDISFRSATKAGSPLPKKLQPVQTRIPIPAPRALTSPPISQSQTSTSVHSICIPTNGKQRMNGAIPSSKSMTPLGKN
ncbi:MAG: hypothetical protein Q9192_007585, partial [Flavoplaca navasiana]